MVRWIRLVGLLCVALVLTQCAEADSGRVSAVAIDITGERVVRLRGDALTCDLDLSKEGPSFYQLGGRSYSQLGKRGGISLGSASKGIPGVVGAFEAHPASINVQIGTDTFVGGGTRGGTFRFSNDLRHVTLDVALRRTEDGHRVVARLRGTIACARRNLKGNA